MKGDLIDQVYLKMANNLSTSRQEPNQTSAIRSNIPCGICKFHVSSTIPFFPLLMHCINQKSNKLIDLSRIRISNKRKCENVEKEAVRYSKLVNLTTNLKFLSRIIQFHAIIKENMCLPFVKVRIVNIQKIYRQFPEKIVALNDGSLETVIALLIISKE